MSCIRRKCRPAYEEWLAEGTSSNLKAYYSYMQSKIALRNAVVGLKDHQGVRSTGSHENAERLLELTQAEYKRNQTT